VRVPKEMVEEVIDDVEDQVAGAPPIARDETLVDLEPEHSVTDIGRKSNDDPTNRILVDV